MSEPVFAFGELLKLLVALAVTIGLFYALALFMKRLQVGTGRSGSLITVLGAMPLGGKEKIWVVDVAGEKLVIGTTPGNVNCLHVLKGDAAVHAENAETTSPSFQVVGACPREGGGRESMRLEQATAVDVAAGLDSRLRGNDGVASSADIGMARAAHDGATQGFAELLNKFRGWQK